MVLTTCHSRAVEHLELVIFGLLVGIVAFASLARPELVLLIFLPPLLYGAAFFTSLRDLRRNARPIALLSIALVFTTMGVVALIAHHVLGLSWGVIVHGAMYALASSTVISTLPAWLTASMPS